MGSIGTYREKGLTDKKFLADLYPSTIIRETARKDGVIYVAASNAREPDKVFALVMPFSRYGDEFIVKEQDEGMGPYDASAPAKILDLLTPTDSEYANRWRESCRENLAKREAAKKVKRGDKVRFAAPLTFTSGAVESEFEFESHSTFRARGSRFRISRWREREFELVGA